MKRATIALSTFVSYTRAKKAEQFRYRSELFSEIKGLYQNNQPRNRKMRTIAVAKVLIFWYNLIVRKN